ncbi:MAG: hypothetical protein AB4063_16120 [Crocosphaera sp.]
MTNQRKEAIKAKLLETRGLISNIEISREFQINKEMVRQYRNQLNIPTFKEAKRLKVIELAEKDLGVKSDNQIAKEIGISPGIVGSVRKEKNIQACPRTNCKSKKHFSNKLSQEQYNSLINELGKLTDIQIAKKYGIAVNTIGYHRRKFKIKAKRTRNQPHEWTIEEINLLGTKSDSKIASLLNINPHQVSYKREQLGIKAFYK